jgi:hypothetical protein
MAVLEHGFADGDEHRLRPCLVGELNEDRPETRVVGEQPRQLQTLLADGRSPACSTTTRLQAPFSRCAINTASLLMASRLSLRPKASISSAMCSKSTASRSCCRSKAACRVAHA